MKHRGIGFAAVSAALLSFASGCVVVDRPQREVVVESDRRGNPPPWAPAHGQRRQVETYYYYPDIEVYFYPSVRRYYWLERGEWIYGAQPPRHYAVEEHARVALDLDYEPHTQHANIKNHYPPGQLRKDQREDKGRDRGRDR